MTLFGKVKIIKTLALSKLVYFLINIPRPPDNIMQEVNRLCFNFLWDYKPSKIKKEMIIKNYKHGGMSMIDLNNYNKSLKISWMKRALLDDKYSTCINLSENDCKTILNTGGYIKAEIMKKLNPFWLEVAQSWNEFLCKLERPAEIRHILSQSVWNNPFFKNKECFNNRWYNLGIRKICDITHTNGEIKSFREMKIEFNIDDNFLLYNTIVVNIPKEWKDIMKNEGNNFDFNGQISYVKQILETSAKNGSRFFYDCLICNNEEPRGHVKWAKHFSNSTIPWNRYHELNKNTIPDTKTRSFQYKIYHHILPTNSILHKFGIKDSDKCTFCKEEKETIEHVIVNCSFSKLFWIDFESFISNKLDRSVEFSNIEKLFGALEENKTINHILTLARKHIYYCKQKGLKPNMNDFNQYLQKTIKLEILSAQISQTPRSEKEKWKLFI